MKVRLGWSGEIARNRWAKTDITLDEYDLARMIYHAGIDVGELQLVPPGLLYRLLDVEAERLLMTKLVTRYGDDPSEGRARIEECNRDKELLLDRIRKSLARPPQ